MRFCGNAYIKAILLLLRCQMICYDMISCYYAVTKYLDCTEKKLYTKRATKCELPLVSLAAAGSCAIGVCEPRQVRKEAAISG